VLVHCSGRAGGWGGSGGRGSRPIPVAAPQVGRVV
jgi:hypothetical protein